MTRSTDDISLLLEVARLYYQHDLSQQQIAQKIGISRPGVSRLLQRAREKGIVRIEIKDPFELGTQIERELRIKYKLQKVIVVPIDDRPQVLKQRLGQAAYTYLETLLTDDMILGVSWGTTMQEMARALLPKKTKNLTVVQLNGGVSKAAYDTHASEIAQSIGANYEAIPYLLPLPAIVDSSALKNSITSDKNIARTLKLANQCEVAIYTIGLFNENSVLVKADYFNDVEIQSLLNKGAIGDICSRIIDHEGNICSKPLNDRTIGIELHDLTTKKHAIAVAGGLDKLPAIRAALAGKWLNTLIVDDRVAGELIQN
jgi:deoxyribonucleoside regulator